MDRTGLVAVFIGEHSRLLNNYAFITSVSLDLKHAFLLEMIILSVLLWDC